MRLRKASNIIGLILFWGWNLLTVFLCIFLIGFSILPFVFSAAINGEIPLSITVCLLILIVMPIYAIYFGVKRSSQAVRFFFGVEIPIIILTLFRIFIVREFTLGSGFLFLSAFIAIGIFAWSLREKENPIRLHPYAATALSTLVLITGLYVAILSGLYAVPLMIDFIKGFFAFNWIEDFGYAHILVFLILALFLFGSLAFFAFPIFIGYFYPKLWSENRLDEPESFSKTKYNLASACFATVWLGVFILLSQQGQADYVSRLNEMSVPEKKIEMQNPKKVRTRLLKAYLYEYRYLGTKTQSRNLIPMYHKSIGSEFVGKKAQAIQSFLLMPLLYQGSQSDGRHAGELYTELFDSSIQRDEKKAITKALEATYNRDEVTAGLMNIGARNVLIREQNIEIQNQENYATVEIEEIYENLTYENQEIFYYFSLPEDAAITGIWIGRTDKREEMDAFIVAPRGAAQKVYEQQVRRNIDPALLEQVGPSQYRLRVFPIPVTRARAQFSGDPRINRRDRDPKLMRVHMRYVVPNLGAENLLPTLLEKRNIDWSKKTTRRLNGTRLKKINGWMPQIDEKETTVSNVKAFDTQMGDRMISLKQVPELPNKFLGKLAIIVDTSYSLKNKEDRLQETITRLNTLKADSLIDFDVYMGGVEDGSMQQKPSLNFEDIKPFGSLTYRHLIKQFLNISHPEDYTAVILLTDQGLYGTDGNFDTARLKTPLHFLHIDKAAAAYDDDILDHIYRSGGGVSTSVDGLIYQLAFNQANTRVIGDRLWTLHRDTADIEFSANSDLKALAARQRILMESFGQPPKTKTLDRLHKLATTHEVVTPYSSMIVLVNDRQKEALKRESESEDRFEREGRDGEEALSSPANPLVSGVPEPHEWLLIILSLIMLFWVWRRRNELEYRLNRAA